jgi:hypothetical protein
MLSPDERVGGFVALGGTNESMLWQQQGKAQFSVNEAKLGKKDCVVRVCQERK